MADPNRIGGARGADGRTLTDVYDQLGAVNANITLLYERLGNNFHFITESAGLFQQEVLGRRQSYDDIQAMRSSLASIQAVGLVILEAIGGDSNGIPGGNNQFKSMADSLYVLRAFALDEQTPRTASFTSIGVIKMLLQRLNDYIVGTGAVENDRGEDLYGEMLKLDQWLTKLSTYIVGDGQQIARGEDFYSGLLAIKDNFGQNTGDATTTLLGLLGSVQYALTQNPAALSTLYSMIRAMTQSLTLPANIDNTVLGELDALRVQMTLTNAILRPTGPTDCENPFVSNGIAFLGLGIAVLGISLTTPATFAVWPASSPSGLDVSNDAALGNIIVSAADWSQWQIYVASRACSFGVILTSSQRFDTNKWITLSGGDDFRFFVDGNDCVEVYICNASGPVIIGGGSPPTDICPPAASGVQWSGFVQRGTEIINFQERPIFAGAFSAAPSPFTRSASTLGAWSNYTLSGSHALLMCLSWDFTGAPTAPIAFTLISSLSGEPDGSNWGASEPVGLGDMTKGCAIYELSTGDGFEKYYFAFAFPIGTVPGAIPANVWLSIGT